MIKSALELARRISEIDDTRYMAKCPIQLPPDVLNGKPVILGYLSEEQRNTFVIFVESSERILSYKIGETTEMIRGILAEGYKFLETLERGPDPVTQEEFFEIQKIFHGLIFPEENVDGCDAFITKYFWSDLLSSLGENTTLKDDLDQFTYPVTVGMFADEQGWCVAVCDPETSKKLPYFYKVKIK